MHVYAHHVYVTIRYLPICYLINNVISCYDNAMYHMFLLDDARYLVSIGVSLKTHVVRNSGHDVASFRRKVAGPISSFPKDEKPLHTWNNLPPGLYPAVSIILN